MLNLHVHTPVAHFDVSRHNIVYEDERVGGEVHYQAFLVDSGSAKLRNVRLRSTITLCVRAREPLVVSCGMWWKLAPVNILKGARGTVRYE